MAWAKNGTPSTLGSAGDTLVISDLTAKKFNVVLSHHIQSGSIWGVVKLNSDAGANYANRFSTNGGADNATYTSSNYAHFGDLNNGVFDTFNFGYIINIATEEKLMISFSCNANTAGAGNAPQRSEIVSKWANTAAQFTTINYDNINAGSYNTGTNLSALGTD